MVEPRVQDLDCRICLDAARGVAFFHGAGMNPELKRKTDDLTVRLTYLRDSL
jgi:hypothetical protein